MKKYEKYTAWRCYLLFLLAMIPVVLLGQQHPKAILTSAKLAKLQSERSRPEYQRFVNLGQVYLNRAASQAPGGYALYAAIWNQQSYITNAIEGLKGMGTGSRDRDLRQADYIIKLSIGYDVLYNHMSFSDRALIRGRIADAANDMSQQVSNGIWWTREATNNHNWVNFASIGLAGFTLAGEDSRAQTWINQALYNHNNRVHKVWDAVSDGSWHEGLGYQDFGVRQYLTFLAAARNNGYPDIDNNAMLRNVGKYTLYAQVPDLTHAGKPYERRLHVAIHGDANWVRPGRLILTNYSASRFQDRYAQLASEKWAYWYPRSSESFTYALAFIFYDPDLQPVSTSQISPDLYANDQEAVFMRSGWNPGDIVLMLKAGPWTGRGNFERVKSGQAAGETWNVSHTHNDDLGLTIWGLGDWLMPEATAYNCCDGGRYAHAVEFHNSFLFDDIGQIGDDRPARGGGQSFSPDWATRDATIPLHVSTEHYSFARATGPKLYEPWLGLQKLNRTVALCRDSKYMTLYDEVGIGTARKIEQIFHFRDDVVREGAWIRGFAETDASVTPSNVNLGIRVISPSSFEITESSQYVNVNDPIDDLEGDDYISFVKVRPSSKAANMKFLELLWPTTSAQWDSKPNVQPLDVASPEKGMSVPLTSSNNTEAWIYNTVGSTTSAGGFVIAQGEIGVVRKASNGEPQRIVLLGAGSLKDQNGSRTLMEKSNDGVLEIAINGGRADVSGTSVANGIRFYGPTITAVYVDGSLVKWTRSGNMVTIGEGGSTPACPAVTASADDGAGSVAANVLDNDLSTRWSGEGNGAWIQFCLGETAKAVNAVDVAFFKGNERIYSFDVLVSDDAFSWKTVATNVKSSGASLEAEHFTFTTSTAKYLRIVGHGNNVNLWNSYTEAKVVEAPYAPCVPVAASGDDGAGSVAENAIDGDLTTLWSGYGDGAWIQFCLGETATSVRGVEMAFHQGDARIATFDIALSLDGVSWTSVATNLKSSGNSLQLQSFSFPAREARFVRIIGYGNDMNLWNSYTEVQITTGAAPLEPVTLISWNDSWRYLDNGTDEGSGWRVVGAAGTETWKSGAAPLGYNNGDEATVVSYGSNASSKYTTTYFYKEVSLDASATKRQYELKLRVDDGAVIYVNGVEQHRINMPSGAISYSTFSSTAAPDDGKDVHTISLAGAAFKTGTNRIAVEVHQQSPGSSDLTFDLQLIGLGTDGGSEYMAGNSYFGANEYIEYIAGNLPIIISAPHGGTLKPSEIPDRDCADCNIVGDSYTEDLARELKTAVYELTGAYPHVIVNRLHRSKLDANRDIIEAADGNAQAEQAWNDFHQFIETAKSQVTTASGKGLYLDIHGHGHTIQRIELGYLLNDDELQLDNSILNTSTYINSSSIKNLVNANAINLTHAKLLRGEFSFGTMLVNKGFAAVPSSTIPYPLDSEPYFRGGYNTRRHSSYSGGSIDGIQIECNKDVRFNETSRLKLANDMGQIIADYLKKHYGISITQSLVQAAEAEKEMALFEEEMANSIAVYPVPAEDELHLHLSQKQGVYQVILIDLQGRPLASWKLASGEHDLEVETSLQGVYLLQIQTEKGRATKRIMLK